jgi:hypothetical protein
MTLPSDSIAVTAGSGQIVATHLVSAKEYEVIMPADADGHIWGSKSTYFYWIPTQSHQTAANTTHWDIYNNSTTFVVRLLSIEQSPDVATGGVFSGTSIQWLFERTTSVGSGGTVLTAWQPDTTQAALDATAATGISARSLPTTGASGSTDLRTYSISPSATSVVVNALAAAGGNPVIPLILRDGGGGIRLGNAQGVRIVQVTGSLIGSSNWLVGFTIE